jgi:L-lysine exporter family protein LysE/ArgO
MEIYLSGFLLCLSLCLDLGIVNVAIIKTAIERGFKPSLIVGLGSTFGDIIYAILSVFGITLILRILFVRWILWIMGTGVLLYLCYNMIHQLLKPSNRLTEINNNSDIKESQYSTFFWNGFGLALSSPSVILWYATIGGGLIASQRIRGQFDTAMFLFGFFSASLVWSFTLAFISYKGGQIMKNQIKKLVSIISAIVFLILAVYIFINGYITLIK